MINKLIDWYWTYGINRQGKYSLDCGGWLDRMIRTIADQEAVQDSRILYSKPAMALWGPSQAGKSTLLAQFIDKDADEMGNGSALSWDASCPARFSGDNKSGQVVVFNPYNKGADASGCVTRFQMRKSVKWPKYPVELHFSTERDILLSLAIGYLSETEAKDPQGLVNLWAGSDIKKLAENAIRESEKTNHAGSFARSQSREAYLLLIEVLDVVDILIDMKEDRYVNLSAEWNNCRSALLNNARLISDTSIVEKFASFLLWDGWKNLTDIYLRLRRKRAELIGKKIYCSLEMALLMVNIAAARSYQASPYIKELVNCCQLIKLDDDSWALGRGNGAPFFANEVEFALTQGLVSLILLPLREDILAKGNPAVYDLLKDADLIDFPGVANEGKDAQPLDDSKLGLDYMESHSTGYPMEKPIYGLTKIMKRGKTASIVISYSRNLNIDAFSLLLRMPAGDTYPSQPPQLMRGIRCWFKSMDKPYAPLARDGELPINLILTFTSKLINMIDSSGLGLTGLRDVFDKLSSLGDLKDPQIVQYLCVNYSEVTDGKINTDSPDRRKEVVDMIRSDKYFQNLFGKHPEMLNAAADLEPGQYGGRTRLFRLMAEQLKNSPRKTLLNKKSERLKSLLEAYSAEALPDIDNDLERRTRDIDKIIETIEEASSEDESEIVRDILAFENINPDIFDILPDRANNVPKYVDNQLNMWLEGSKRAPLQTCIGFENLEHRTRVLSYLSERVANERPMIIEYISNMVASPGRPALLRVERKECRRLLACLINKCLFPSLNSHKSERECRQMLETISRQEQSAAKIAIIDPFLNAMKSLRDSLSSTSRPPQPGDRELADLLQAYKQSIHN